jgi:hypothetical protein
MTDTQFYVLITVLGTGLAGIGAAIRFSVSRVIKALDANSLAMLDNTKSNAVLSTKIDAIAGYVERRSHVPSNVKDFIREEISATHDVDPRIANMPDREDRGGSDDDATPVDPGSRPTKSGKVHGGSYGHVKPRKGTQT